MKLNKNYERKIGRHAIMQQYLSRFIFPFNLINFIKYFIPKLKLIPKNKLKLQINPKNI